MTEAEQQWYRDNPGVYAIRLEREGKPDEAALWRRRDSLARQMLAGERGKSAYRNAFAEEFVRTDVPFRVGYPTVSERAQLATERDAARYVADLSDQGIARLSSHFGDNEEWLRDQRWHAHRPEDIERERRADAIRDAIEEEALTILARQGNDYARALLDSKHMASHPGVVIGLDLGAPGGDMTGSMAYIDYGRAVGDPDGAKVRRDENGKCVGCGAVEGEFHEVCNELNRALTGVPDRTVAAYPGDDVVDTVEPRGMSLVHCPACGSIGERHKDGCFASPEARRQDQLRDNVRAARQRQFMKMLEVPARAAPSIAELRVKQLEAEVERLQVLVDMLRDSRDLAIRRKLEAEADEREAVRRLDELIGRDAPPDKDAAVGRAIGLTVTGWRPVV